jgi:hypothetical protein
MTNPRGALKVEANGTVYTLWLGFSVLAELQEQHGNDFLQKLDPPKDAGPDWLPPTKIIVDLMIAALGRYHAEVADRWLVDEIIAQNADAFAKLMGAAFPDAGDQSGNVKKPKRAA